MSTKPAEDLTGAEFDKAGQDSIEGRPVAKDTSDAQAPERLAPTGPHGEPALTNPDATPGAGALPSASPDDEADAATG